MAIRESAVPFKEIKRYGGYHGSAGVVMKEILGLSIIQIAAFPGAETSLYAALASAMGITLDGSNGQGAVNDDGSIRAVWISLHSYLIVADGLDDGVLHTQLAAICGEHALVSDQSAGRVCFELKGKSVVDLLMSESATNFEPDFMGVGESRAASWAGIACVVHFVNAADTAGPVYRLFPNRSFAQSLFEELCEAGREYAVQVIG